MPTIHPITGIQPLPATAPTPAPSEGPLLPRDSVSLSRPAGATPSPAPANQAPPARTTAPRPRPITAHNGQNLEEFLRHNHRRLNTPRRGPGLLQRAARGVGRVAGGVGRVARAAVRLALTPVGKVGLGTATAGVLTAGTGGWAVGRAIGQSRPDGRHTVDEGVQRVLYDTLFAEGRPLHGR